MSLDLLHDLNRWIMGDGTYNGFREGLVEEHVQEFVHKMSTYYQYHSWAQEQGLLSSSRNLPKFFEDPNHQQGYADYVPSANTLQRFHLQWLAQRDDFETAVQQSVGGSILAVDMSHKITKLIFVNGSVKVFFGLLTIMNQVTFVACRSYLAYLNVDYADGTAVRASCGMVACQNRISR